MLRRSMCPGHREFLERNPFPLPGCSPEPPRLEQLAGQSLFIPAKNRPVNRSLTLERG
jgi:hypothetical protein